MLQSRPLPTCLNRVTWQGVKLDLQSTTLTILLALPIRKNIIFDTISFIRNIMIRKLAFSLLFQHKNQVAAILLDKDINSYNL